MTLLLKRYLLKTLLLLTAFVLMTASTSLKQQDDTNARIKAIFVYNFTKYFEWPSDYKQGEFVIGIIGNSGNLTGELTKMAATQKVGAQTIRIKTFKNVEEMSRCNILYMSDDASIRIEEVVKRIAGQSTLVITSRIDQISKGASISFVTENNKLRFDLNVKEVKARKLSVSSKLNALARQVIN
ncbi:MAG: YfiR family protein [Bacteroidetes bacterium]|nr:YfiR family protein [Bacteroidota bacterium]